VTGDFIRGLAYAAPLSLILWGVIVLGWHLL